MEVAAFFLLVIILVVAAVAGVLLFGTGSFLWYRKLDPEEDKIEGAPEAEEPRPEHLRVANEQKARFAPDR
jgi:hypothetical protein